MANGFENLPIICRFPFTESGSKVLSQERRGSNWPVVYLLCGKEGQKDVIYIGETSNAVGRMRQHLSYWPLKTDVRFKDEFVIFHETFNKSAILDTESMLIEHLAADGKYKLENRNGGQSRLHDYFNRLQYQRLFRTIWKELLNWGIASKKIEEIENSNLFKYSPFKSLTPEQYDVEAAVLPLVEEAIKTKKKRKIVINGGAGTGKSVLAIALAKRLRYLSERPATSGALQMDLDVLDEDEFEEAANEIVATVLAIPKGLSIAFVAPVTAFRKAIKDSFKGDEDLRKVKVIGPFDLTKGEGYDVVIVDEAHRLRHFESTTCAASYRKACDRWWNHVSADPSKPRPSDREITQLDWAIGYSNYATILFYDAGQNVSTEDMKGEEFASRIGDDTTSAFTIEQQVRMASGSDYVHYMKELVSGQKPNKPFAVTSNYDFRVFDSYEEMEKELLKREEEERQSPTASGLCRVVSGYGHPWRFNARGGIRKGFEKATFDFDFDGAKRDWFVKGKDTSFVMNSYPEGTIGSVYDVQGFDLNYAAVVIDRDMKVDDGCLVPDPSYFFSPKGKSKDKKLTNRDIVNAYLVLLTRGIKGTYIYSPDPAVLAFFKEHFQK